MRNRKTLGDVDLDSLIDLNADPSLSPASQAEARKRLRDLCGPLGDQVGRLCTQAAAARRDAAAMRAELDRLRGGAQLLGIVTGVENGHARVLVGGTERIFPRPDDLTLQIGQTAYTDADGRVLLAAGDFLVGGSVYVFCEMQDNRRALVRSTREGVEDDARQWAMVSDAVDTTMLAPGDRVLGWSICGGNLVLVTRRLGPVRRVVADDGITRVVARQDIVGLDDVFEATELMFLGDVAPEFMRILERANSATSGVIYQGVPGTGKTEVALYFATSVRERGGRALYRTASHYLSKWVGVGAAYMREDFALLEAAFKETGVRPLLIIDEIEAIALDRGHAAALHGGHLDVLDTLLSLISRSEVRVVGISNVANRLVDSALLRAGRLRLVRFPSTMTPEQTTTLVAKCLVDVPLVREGVASGGNGTRMQAFGEALSDLVFAPAGALAELLRVQLADGRTLAFGAQHLATPATIADGIVRPMLAGNVLRDVRAGRKTPAPLTLDELRAATIAHFAERAAAITKDNARSMLPDGIPDDQAVTKVEITATDAAKRTINA